jgi:hypothetical protein
LPHFRPPFRADSIVCFLNLPRRNPHDVDGVADNVGGALLAFGASGISSRFRSVWNATCVLG